MAETKTRAAEARSPISGGDASRSPAQVLLVDDQPARLLTYEAILSGLGVNCVRALSGEEALERLLGQDFAVIVLDVSMPIMDGFEVARLIRTHPRLERTPIIFVTAVHVTELDRLKGYEVGGIDYISVPIVPEILRSKVALLVELHERRSQLEALNRQLEEARARNEAEHARALEQRELQLQAVFEHPDELTIVLQAELDASGAIVDWVYRNANKNAIDLLGGVRENVVGRRLSEVLPDRAARVSPLCAQVLRTRTPVRYETSLGGTHYLITLYAADVDSVISSGVDVTERKATEAALRDSQERLLLAKGAAQLGIFDWDVASGRLRWDERACELWGVPPDAPLSYDVFLAGLHPDDRDRAQAAVKASLDPLGGGRIHVMYRVINRIDGVTRWIEATGRVFFDGERASRMVGTVQDVTERKLAEDRLREMDRRKDEFLAMLAHELRNPLAPIRNAAEVLSHLTDDEQPKTFVGMIRRQTAHLARILDDLLDVARITQGRIELRTEIVAARSCIELAIETIKPLIRDKHQRLTFSQPSEPLYVAADKVRLEQCVTNLLNNAAKYTDAGGEIQVRLYAEAASAVIEVADSGVGIAPEFLPHVFDLFVQSERSLDRAQGGLGIGLSVCKRLIELHGGSISCASPGPGQGATFAIRLPMRNEPVESVDGTRIAGATRRRVLVVDDNRDAADSLAMCLELEGHETKSVYCGEGALEEVRSFAPDVVLLDIGLPRMDGYEVARRIKARAPAIRVVALSGYGQEEDRQRSAVAGFDAHLVKPIELAALKKMLAT